MLEIPKKIFEEMIEHLRSEFPFEGCGVLAGKRNKVEKLIRLTNTKKSPTAYLADPFEQLNMLKEIEREQIEMLAIYHSHPNNEAYPSMEDIEKAFYNEQLYLIVSFLDKKNPVARIFSIVNREISEEKFKVF
ncbi:MAG: hypothetical protein A3C43_02220 [Candidatus Schekmanbacteria bacterium RIFCSPHIGHO2_02_FULL_38_11]|uniref:MPN domain-containing protein n=1 Tax=Candidatus Schekmanbacteria bacterium RIFCSPLOWO2_12_FULL_38_15 TaxID=1817883 RepID=A0A1F7SFS4_9BACT|nr:MAG: hypothetical protein A2043_11375 [Candidatus Schekmanbacteria bacterium GWA2_38_9]OGL49415.1 MAG: hypothetical protein A3H37_06985 [Candidatus Schekmanbacteria bacterium RIFCSPLOWO2_02_FULL_38_14]OGL50663.1 MAG: hypothetical protein A3C43_02220 [Candidatus Schekmanbacteria bacterium RIFCSPHIGHO2_02_FULL_38_11]OGL52640.1 MAG: hypothetical protein A3G31_11810 [Candidatus Schekmanbacteria bacterium RIFCSPLOWO2_12_FULL_38_15]